MDIALPYGLWLNQNYARGGRFKYELNYKFVEFVTLICDNSRTTFKGGLNPQRRRRRWAPCTNIPINIDWFF